MVFFYGESELLENVLKCVDFIRLVEDYFFGREGYCGVLIFLMKNEGGVIDLMFLVFVYLGFWLNNKYMCFRF